MAERGTINSGIRLDMQQLQLEARHRWLRAAEICEILRNYHRFQISSEPPSRPPSGSLFLFDRKVLRYFRKDGHNWRKKKDGKTIKEAHEKLKVGSIDVLHCYYAHGEDNENFQRRSYWLLEEDFMHIVFVHYLETKGNKSSIRDMEYISNSQRTSSLSNSYCTHSESFSANAGSPSATSALTAAFEDVDSGDNLQAISKFPVHFNFQHRGEVLDDDKTGATLNNSKLHVVSPVGSAGNPLLVPELSCDSTDSGEAKVVNPTSQSTIHDLESWEEVFEQCNRGSEPGLAYPLVSSTLPTGLEFIGQENGKFGQLLDNNLAFSSVFEGPAAEIDWQKNIQLELSSTEFHGNPGMEEDLKYNSSILKQPLLGSLRAEEGLLKVDSFSKWMSKELGDGGELQLGSPSNISWCNNAPDESSISRQLDLDSYSLSPSISQDQLFSILDFSPNRAYTDYETEVIVMGKFLKSQQEIAKYNWSCMFGEVEVPAEIVGDGVLCCYAPPHSVGRVPFYVTCSNRLACSEVREFEFQDRHGIAGGETHGNSIDEQLLHRRLEILVSINSDRVSVPAYGDISGKQQIISKINLLMDGETGSAFWEAASQNRSALSKTLKEKLYVWLLDKVNEDGKGPNVLDKEGQGVLHLAAALGYDWVIQPILTAGVNINFRDVNGWTALHWAAFCGREKIVALLVALGAAPGALTDPSPESPLCRTPADLASANGFKGISGFLAESSLTTHLASLNMSDQKVDVSTEDAVRRAVQAIAERSATPAYEDDASLKDSLAAVCNATQAASRIHQVYRMQSFQRKQMGQYEDDKFGLTDELISSLVSSRMQKAGQYAAEQAQSAAVQIQKKYRGWKKRKEFLIIRQRVVKIQAHIRGYQVRRRYRAVIWSVGILEKVILRWRRKGTGLRGYRSGTQIKEPSTSTQEIPKEDDDYDFLKEGRKQTEERLQKALVRVKSMVQYPEARLQYRRLLTSVEDFQKNQQQQQVYNRILDSPGGATIEGEEDMIDVDKLLDDESFMAIAFD